MTRPQEHEHAPYYAGYIALVPEDDVLAALAAQADEVRALAERVPPDRESHRYAPGKWSIREVVGHVTDGERVFGHRAFCISRGEEASLPGFDEQAYVARSNHHRRPLADLVADFAALRQVNRSLLESLPPEAWSNLGIANGTPVSVRALAFIMAGHVRHHLGVLRARYGIAPP